MPTVGTLHNTPQVGTWLPLIGEGLSQCVNVFNYVFISGALMQGLLRATQKNTIHACLICSGADTRRPIEAHHQTE